MRMDARRLPRRLILGKLHGARKRGRGEKEKERVDCVKKNIRAFGILLSLQEDVWYNTVVEGGRTVHGRVEEDRRTSVCNAPGEKDGERDWKRFCCAKVAVGIAD